MKTHSRTYLSLYLPNHSLPLPLSKKSLPFSSTAALERLEPLVRELQRLTPLVSIEPVHGDLILDLSGTGRLHGSLDSIARKVASVCGASGIEARIGSAPTIGTAWATARYSNDPIAHFHHAWYDSPLGPFEIETRARSVFSGTTLRALRIAEETIDLLKNFGVRTIGELLALPRRSLAQRFGEHLLLRISQFLGERSEPLPPIPLESRLGWKKEYMTPIGRRERLCEEVLTGFTELFAKLRVHGLVARLFVLDFEYPKADFVRAHLYRQVALNTASEEMRIIRSIVEPALERLSFPHGVTQLEIHASALEPFQCSQGSFESAVSSGLADPKALDVFINMLTVQMGRDHIHQIFFQQSHLPERSFRYEPIPERFRSSMKPVDVRSPLYRDFLDRPSKILSAPLEVTVVAMLPDRPPSWLSWNGATVRIVQGFGPERIAPEWWREDSLEDRDYFKIQDDSGRWLWIYRTNGSHRWFVHGWWC